MVLDQDNEQFLVTIKTPKMFSSPLNLHATAQGQFTIRPAKL